MSSVTRFIRQIPVSTTYYDAGSIDDNTSLGDVGNAYQFIPDGSNYVGNYPPGYMTQASATSANPVGSGLANLITTTIASTVGGSASLVLRDMGKTIKAAYDVNGAALPATPLVYGFFREVQLLNPKALGLNTNTVIGGVNGSNFGVGGPAPAYLTFYIPVTVAGVRGPAVTQNAYAIAGGQM